MPSATIVGAGVFGAWIASALHTRGWRVTLIEQHGPGNSRSSSGGETRIIRSGYGDHATYAAWARDSLPRWRALERDAGVPIFTRTGALFISRQESWLAATLDTLRREGVRAEWLTAGDLAERYPQLAFADAAGAVFEPEAGVLFARRAVQTLARILESRGVQVVRARADARALLRGNRADALIFAAGPWLPTLLPDLLGDFIVPTRQEVFFFAGDLPAEAGSHTGQVQDTDLPAAAERREETNPVASGFSRKISGSRRTLSFLPEQFPAWVAFDEGIYGLPDFEHRGVKIAIDAHGPAIDPETMDRVVDATALARIRDVLRRRIPALASAPLLESRVCQYENTPDGHFLLDRMPGHDRVWIAGGGSGHGFKHGPSIGEYMADLIEGRRTPDRLFALEGRPSRARAVY